MTKPHWKTHNLVSHYHRHPAGADRDCWCDLLGKSPGPVSIDEYRDESFRIIDHPWLAFQAQYRQDPYSDYELTDYCVDERQCLTAMHHASQQIKTCFHVHPRWQHELLRGDEGKIEFLKKWRRKQTDPDQKLRQVTIRKLDVSGETRRVIHTYVKELTAPVRGRIR